MSNSIIEINDLSFEYPGKKALENINLKIKEGSVTALVGPNGAGKTTLMRCISALETPFSGDIKINGIDTQEDPRKCHELIGYLPDFFGLYENLTVEQTITFFLMSNGVDEKLVPKIAKEAATRVDLEDKFSSKASELSRGMRQRLAIAIAIANNPKIAILDEPAAGLDPEARRSLSSLFLKLNKEGTTLIVSSHILTELEDYCDEMIIINDGKIKAHKEASEKKEDSSKEAVEISFINLEKESFTSYIKKLDKVEVIEILEENKNITVKISYNSSSYSRAELMKKLLGEGFEIEEFKSIKESLSDFYHNKINNKI